MEQNQTAPAQSVNPVVEALEQAEPVQPSSMPMQAGPAPKKKSSVTLLSIILLLILALGGIGFGVWAFMDGNAQKDKLNNQITSLRQEISTLTEKNVELQDTIDSLKAGGSSSQDSSDGTSDSTSTDDTDTEEGYHILSIGDCVADGGFGSDGSLIIKCDATTKDGTGKFVYSSENNELKFVVSE